MKDNLIEKVSTKLPQTYEAARVVLAECQAIDECKDWADKAAALASYAKQAEDTELEKMAVRIRSRAMRRAGELLKQFQIERARTDLVDAGDLQTQAEAGAAAGFSERQIKTAVRIANIPEPEFNAGVESIDPPTVTDLAAMGTAKRLHPDDTAIRGGHTPEAFNEALHFRGMIEDYARELAEYDLYRVLQVLDTEESKSVKEAVAKIDAIHGKIVTALIGGMAA